MIPGFSIILFSTVDKISQKKFWMVFTGIVLICLQNLLCARMVSWGSEDQTARSGESPTGSIVRVMQNVGVMKAKVLKLIA